MTETAAQRLEKLRGLESVVNPAQQRLDELRDLQLVDSTPFELPTRERISQAQSAGSRITNTTLQPAYSDRAKELASQGVDVVSGAPVGRFSAGFAQNEALQAEHLKKELNKYYSEKLGRDVDVRVISGEDGLEFINPESNRRTLVDELTSTPSDIAEAAGPGITVGGAVAGSLVSPIAGTAGGAFVGESTRRFIGDKLGVRDESVGEAAKGATGVALTEAVFAKASTSVAKLAQTFRRFFRPTVIDPADAQRILSEAESSQAIADEISQRTGQKFQPRTSQLSRDPQLLQADEVVRRSNRFGPDIRATERQNETALESFFDQLNPQGEVTTSQVGRGVKNEARRQTAPRVDAAKTNADTQVAELERLTSEIPNATNPTIRAELSDQATKSLRILKEDFEDVAWDKARELYGHNPETGLSSIKIPIGGKISGTLKRLQVEADAAIDPSVGSGKRALVPEGLTGDAVDLHQLNVHLSQLKRRQRLAKGNEVITDPSGRDVRLVIRDLQKARDDYLRANNRDVYDQLIEAEGLTARRADLFDKGITGKLVRKENGAYDLTDKSLVAEALGSGDRQAMQHLVNALDNHPAGVPTLQKSFMAFYRNEVVRDGIPDAARHRVFMENNEEALNVLFPGNSKIRTLGEFEKETAKTVKRFENFEKAVQKSFRGKVQDIAPERVVEDFFSATLTDKEASHLMSLAKSAGYEDQYQKAIGNFMRNRFVSETSGINLNAMSKFLNVPRNQTRLTTAFGETYHRDMNTLIKGLSDTRTTGAGIQTTNKPTMFGALAEALARVTVARPLSPAGVGLTRLLSTRALAAERVMNEIITDPQALHMVVVNANKPLQHQSVARILGILGGSELIDFEDTLATSLVDDAFSEDEE